MNKRLSFIHRQCTFDSIGGLRRLDRMSKLRRNDFNHSVTPFLNSQLMTTITMPTIV